MGNKTTRTPQVGETWRHKRSTRVTVQVRYADETGAYGLDEDGYAYGLPAYNFANWEPAPTPRPSIDFTRWAYAGGIGGVAFGRGDNAPGVHVWSDEDGNLHAEWID